MKAALVCVLMLVILASTASAATIRLHFTTDIFNNKALNVSAQNYTSVYSRYFEGKTQPTFVVDGFKLRGEEFMLAGQDFYRTYSDPQTGENYTVFELWSWRDAQVDQRTTEIQDQLNQSQAKVAEETKRADEAEAASFPALSAALGKVILVAGLLIAVYFFIVFIRKNQDKSSQNQFINWSPEMEKKKTREDELTEAFARLERLGGSGYE